jgi:hypothetical protein
MRRTDEELAMLRSMLSVCAWCKGIHDDARATWIVLEEYTSRRDATRLSHGICPDCAAHVQGVLPPHA